MPASGAIRAGRAFVELFADDSRLVRGLRHAQRRIHNFGSKLKGIGSRMAGLGIAAAAPIAGATKIFAGFDDQMRAVQAVIGATGDQFNRLNDQAKMLGRTTSFSASRGPKSSPGSRASYGVTTRSWTAPAIPTARRRTSCRSRRGS